MRWKGSVGDGLSGHRATSGSCSVSWFKGKDGAAKATTANSMQWDREGRARHRAGMQ